MLNQGGYASTLPPAELVAELIASANRLRQVVGEQVRELAATEVERMIEACDLRSEQGARSGNAMRECATLMLIETARRVRAMKLPWE